MWHLNIPIMRRLGHVAEHEREAVLGLARTWWGFAENLPPALREAKQTLFPKPPAASVRQTLADGSDYRGKASSPFAQLHDHSTGISTQEVASGATSLQSVDVGFEVMRGSACNRTASHASHAAPGLVVEDGKLRHYRELPKGAANIFRLVR
mmetsp:Transcript_69875/g.167730  ORF Transcript_69875/g.167730 Transcript_69875/m.167730 type:complete len:152 (-) Transcript_69875:102-557(-)|eukprot:CAMPEP_0178439408 /NCGR_PEP_ID=MMETSP0689_2-20121128/36139_1 /TAXON_ID=160604 /ORGANISM="Amphidinium massartii, Strain CS-259" /LENGTH=151 /DNA_ID=CAMNT_0020061933 /DNA_START=62 /DNA_END=517 /DNA_ORIENTATION=-